MSSETSHAGSLSIQRLRSLYLIASDHPAPHELAAKLDGVAAGTLQRSIAARMVNILPDTASDIWLIRRLNLDVDLNVSSTDDQLASVWASQAVDSLAHVLYNDADAEGILHFPDRAAYLAYFIRSRVVNPELDRWYYQGFAGLRSLPLSAAIRTALCRDTHTGLTALLQLSEPDLHKIIDSLDEHDAILVLNQIASEEVDTPASMLFESLDPALLGMRGLSPGEGRSALELYLRVRRAPAHIAGPAVQRLMIALVWLAHEVAQSHKVEHLLNMLSFDNAADLYARAGPATAERLSPLLGAPTKWLHSIIGRQHAGAKDLSRTAHRFTPLGAIFLLLPLLDLMPIERATAAWPCLDHISPTILVRLLILLKTASTRNVARMFDDAVLRELVGVPGSLDAASLFQWQRSLSRQQLFAFQFEIGRWQIEESIDTLVSLHIFTLQTTPRILICLDALHDSLIFALPDSRSARRLLSEARSDLTARFSPHEGEHFQGHAKSIQQSDLTALHNDLDFLSFPSAFRETTCSDLTFSVAARTLLRAFSGRLTGFSHSSLEYLQRNFLDVHATLDDQTDCCNVRLSSPPLHVVLALAGMNRQAYNLSWNGRKIAIFPQ